MPKISTPKRIRKEDVKPEYAEIVDAIAGTVNDFNDEVYQALNNGIDFSNLNQQVVTVDLTTNAAGVLSNPPQIKYNLIRGKYQGCIVINVQNLVNSNSYPTTTPGLSTVINGNIITVLNATGLPASSSYRLTLILIGG